AGRLAAARQRSRRRGRDLPGAGDGPGQQRHPGATPPGLRWHPLRDVLAGPAQRLHLALPDRPDQPHHRRQSGRGGHRGGFGDGVWDQDGTSLDPAGLTIASSSPADQVLPRSASNGSNHLVVWWDGTSLRAQRVKGSDGSLLDGAGLALPATPGVWSSDAPRYDVASDGTDYLVLWLE